MPLPKSVDEFKTRKEYNEWKEKQKSFVNPNNLNYQFKKNKYGEVASKRAINQLKRNNELAIRLAKQRIKDAENLPYYVNGKKEGTVGQQMKQMGQPNAAGIKVPEPFNFDDVRNDDRFKALEESMRKRSSIKEIDERMNTMRKNFMYVLAQTFNDDASELVYKMSKLDNDEFFDIYNQFKEFDFTLYGSENTGGLDEDGKVQKLMQYVDMYQRGEVNKDLSNFPKRNKS